MSKNKPNIQNKIKSNQQTIHKMGRPQPILTKIQRNYDSNQDPHPSKRQRPRKPRRSPPRTPRIPSDLPKRRISQQLPLRSGQTHFPRILQRKKDLSQTTQGQTQELRRTGPDQRTQKTKFRIGGAAGEDRKTLFKRVNQAATGNLGAQAAGKANPARERATNKESGSGQNESRNRKRAA